jgi:hypothetical protein
MNIIHWNEDELSNFMKMCNVHKEEINIKKFPLYRHSKSTDYGLLLTIKNKQIYTSLSSYIRQLGYFKAHWHKFFNQIVIVPYGFKSKQYHISNNKWIINICAQYKNDTLIHDVYDGFEWKFMFTYESNGLIRISSCDLDRTRWINFIPDSWSEEDHLVCWHAPWNCVNLNNARKLYTDKLVSTYIF